MVHDHRRIAALRQACPVAPGGQVHQAVQHLLLTERRVVDGLVGVQRIAQVVLDEGGVGAEQELLVDALQRAIQAPFPQLPQGQRSVLRFIHRMPHLHEERGWTLVAEGLIRKSFHEEQRVRNTYGQVTSGGRTFLCDHFCGERASQQQPTALQDHGEQGSP